MARLGAATLGVILALAGMARAQELPGPGFLNRPVESPAVEPAAAAATEDGLLRTPVEPPLGFTGHSGILPRDEQQTSDFVPVEDRWRIGFPAWDRYGWGFPLGVDYPYKEGHWWDPFNQNVLKGDYPLIGQNTFLNLTASSFMTLEGREVPTATTPFESTSRPYQRDFFGRPSQALYNHNFSLTFDLFHGDTSAFKPADWRVLITPVFNVNYFANQELAVVNPNVLFGVTRGRTFSALQEYFVESKITDTSPYYDFMSVRVGSQPFNSDFRSFIFNDVNRAVRLFGTRLANRDQFNLVYFRQAEKDTNSELNTQRDRGQDVFIANYYRQDFCFPGYTAQWSVHYNHDPASFKFDKNNFLVRPDPVGVFQPHTVDAVYLGMAGDGHIGPINITHAFYWVLGRDTLNPLANVSTAINAQFAAVELSYDRDWARFRGSFLFASGDRNPNNGHATGFDAILDNPEFAGGTFSFWQRQAIRLQGVNLTNRKSLLPDLRSSKIQGQSNFVNPGLKLGNLGVDFELTPKLRMINNANLLWFDETASLQTFAFQQTIHKFIGTDISSGIEYRPLLNNNIIMVFGAATLLPGRGFRDLYNPIIGTVSPMAMGFLELTLTY